MKPNSSVLVHWVALGIVCGAFGAWAPGRSARELALWNSNSLRAARIARQPAVRSFNKSSKRARFRAGSCSPQRAVLGSLYACGRCSRGSARITPFGGLALMGRLPRLRVARSRRRKHRSSSPLPPGTTAHPAAGRVEAPDHSGPLTKPDLWTTSGFSGTPKFWFAAKRGGCFGASSGGGAGGSASMFHPELSRASGVAPGR